MKLKLKPSYSTLAFALTVMAKTIAEENLETATTLAKSQNK